MKKTEVMKKDVFLTVLNNTVHLLPYPIDPLEDWVVSCQTVKKTQ